MTYTSLIQRLKTDDAKKRGASNVRRSEKGVSLNFDGRRIDLRIDNGNLKAYAQRSNYYLANLGNVNKLHGDKLFDELEYVATNIDSFRKGRVT